MKTQTAVANMETRRDNGPSGSCSLKIAPFSIEGIEIKVGPTPETKALYGEVFSFYRKNSVLVGWVLGGALVKIVREPSTPPPCPKLNLSRGDSLGWSVGQFDGLAEIEISDELVTIIPAWVRAFDRMQTEGLMVEIMGLPPYKGKPPLATAYRNSPRAATILQEEIVAHYQR